MTAIEPLPEIPDAASTATTIERLRDAGVLGDCWADFSLVLRGDDEEADYYTFESIGRFLAASHDAVRWWIGDWLVYGEGAFGDRIYQAAEALGLSERTLLDYQHVARYVPRSRRRPDLHFGHHRVVAPIRFTPDQQRDWLQRATDLNLSTREFKAFVEQQISSFPQALAETTSEEKQDAREGSSMDVHYSSASPEWETPQDLFDKLDAEFQFDLDVCATPENTKCRSFYTAEADGLAQSWLGADCWMNPPYGAEIGAWVEKAYRTAEEGGRVVCCLLPARTDTGWWWDFCRYGEVRFLRGRLRFGGGENGAPFPSAVVIFGRPAKVVWWER